MVYLYSRVINSFVCTTLDICLRPAGSTLSYVLKLHNRSNKNGENLNAFIRYLLGTLLRIINDDR